MAGMGDVHNQRGVPLADAKEMVIARNWTSVSIAPNGHCFFKKFNYDLNPTTIPPTKPPTKPPTTPSSSIKIDGLILLNLIAVAFLLLA